MALQMEKNRNFISSLARGLRILETFSDEKAYLRLSELSELTGMNKAAIQRYLFTLLELGYLERDENKLYRPSLKVLSLGFGVLRSLETRKLAYPYMKELSKRIQQTVNLAILDGTEVVLIERTEVKKLIGEDLQVGSRLPVYCSSLGKAILAFIPQNKMIELVNQMKLERLTEYTITDKKELIKDLTNIRKQGYSFHSQELHLNSRATGAPVFSGERAVNTAVSIAVDASSFSSEDVKSKFSPLVVELAAKISAMLGGTKR